MKNKKIAIALVAVALLAASCPLEEPLLEPLQSVSGLSPESGITISDTTPTLSWEWGEYWDYEIQASDNIAAFSTVPAIKVDDNEFTWKTPLSDGEALYWRVRGIDSRRGTGPWSSTYVLYIYEGAVSGLTPSSGSVTFNAKPVLSWNTVDGAVKYQVQLKKNDEPDDYDDKHEVTALSYSPEEPLNSGQTYYWRVRVEDKDGHLGVWGATTSLKTSRGALSGLSPADESKTSDTLPTFSWDEVEGAARYELRIADSRDGLESVSPIYTGEAEYTPSQDLSDNQTYYWQVRAADNDGEFGEWSEVLSLWIGYTIGTHGPAGGVIFYDKGDYTDGWRWLEAMPFDQSTGIKAGSSSVFTEAGIGEDVFDSYQAIGLGKSNTEFIVAGLGNNGGTAYAAKTCYDLEWGGYDDWFLPSIDELLELHKQKDAVGGGFIDDAYWSSSPGEGVWYAKYFGSGSHEYGQTIASVRAVRAVGKVGSVSVQNAFVNVMAPTLNWKAVDGAGRYDVQMAESYTELANAQTISVTGTSYTPTENLTDGNIRYWRVRAVNSRGEKGIWTLSTLAVQTVSFHSSGGSTVSSQYVARGGHAAEPTTPTRSGYAFDGWYSNSNLSYAWTFGSDTVASDITLYAKWKWVMSGSSFIVPETILVQGGTFQMGSTDSEASSDESPVHGVTVDSFYMAETEVTHRQYLAFLNAAGVSASGQLNGNEVIDMDESSVAFSHNGDKFAFAGSFRADNIDSPVIEVTWYGAVEYSNWLSGQEGLTKAYSISGASVTWNQSANGYRLPTEAEWEYAARGGAQSNGYKYAGSNDVDEVGWYRDNAGSNDVDEVGWYRDNSESKTQPVKGKKANELGLYDMSGNVWEWCWDWYDSDYYSSSPESNPTGPSSGSYRVERGGSWSTNPAILRVAIRHSSNPDGSFLNLGFRLALGLSPQTPQPPTR